MTSNIKWIIIEKMTNKFVTNLLLEIQTFDDNFRSTIVESGKMKMILFIIVVGKIVITILLLI